MVDPSLVQASCRTHAMKGIGIVRSAKPGFAILGCERASRADVIGSQPVPFSGWAEREGELY